MHKNIVNLTNNMDKFNKQYSPEELEEMKRDLVSHQKLTEWRRERQRELLLERLRQQSQDRLRNLLK